VKISDQNTEQPTGDARLTFLEAMSHLPGPVALITTGKGEKRLGLTVSALCSLSADPPSLLTCVNKGASAHNALLESKVFGVNVLRPSQLDIASLFTKKGVDRFASVDWTEGVTGAPLLRTALITFECRLSEAVDGFSHSILIGTVENTVINASEEDLDCLVWHQRRYRTVTEIA
jgi:flavin reductase